MESLCFVKGKLPEPCPGVFILKEEMEGLSLRQAL